MEELSYKARVAVVKLLGEILNADKIVHEKEVKYLDEVVKSLNLDENYKEDVDALLTLEALATIRILRVVQKREIAEMMGKMIVIDNDINYNEVKLYNAFCESCDIEKGFNGEDYPEYSLSGPFVNAEDVMNGF
jgi:hypothetical protein